MIEIEIEWSGEWVPYWLAIDQLVGIRGDSGSDPTPEVEVADETCWVTTTAGEAHRVNSSAESLAQRVNALKRKRP